MTRKISTKSLSIVTDATEDTDDETIIETEMCSSKCPTIAILCCDGVFEGKLQDHSTKFGDEKFMTHFCKENYPRISIFFFKQRKKSN